MRYGGIAALIISSMVFVTFSETWHNHELVKKTSEATEGSPSVLCGQRVQEALHVTNRIAVLGNLVIESTSVLAIVKE